MFGVNVMNTGLIGRIFGKGEDKRAELFIEPFVEMLDLVEAAYLTAVDAILEPGQDPAEALKIVEGKDAELNRKEETLRKNVLVVVTGEGYQNATLSEGMALLRSVGDAERMGDYTKNITRVLVKTPGFLKSPYKAPFAEQVDWVRSAFPRIRQAWVKQDVETALSLSAEANRLSKSCDPLLDQLLEKPEAGNEATHAVSTALLFRFHKRFLRHLFNLCIIIAKPFDEQFREAE